MEVCTEIEKLAWKRNGKKTDVQPIEKKKKKLALEFKLSESQSSGLAYLIFVLNYVF